jgi:hypothetical protein
MKNNSEKTKKMIAAAFILGASVLTAGVASADTGPRTDNHMTSFVNAIAAKFNLKAADVQSVVDQTMATERATMDAKRSQNEATRLAKAVTDGKLTQAQADLIKAKQAEMKTFMDSLKTKTQSERMTAMKTQMDSLKQWADANNIPLNFIQGAGMGKGGMMGHKNK